MDWFVKLKKVSTIQFHSYLNITMNYDTPTKYTIGRSQCRIRTYIKSEKPTANGGTILSIHLTTKKDEAITRKSFMELIPLCNLCNELDKHREWTILRY
jgi:site-specific recombinase